MKTNFNINTIKQIAENVLTYSKLFVLTNGQMFRDQSCAKEALHSINAIHDDDIDSFVGLVTLTAEMFTSEKLMQYAKDPESFNKLFESAVIPRARENQPKPFVRATSKEGASADAVATVADVFEKAKPKKEAEGIKLPEAKQPVADEKPAAIENVETGESTVTTEEKPNLFGKNKK